jgi:hypothetical protein
MTDLGTLGGHQSNALDINDLGEISGWCETASSRTHACLWQMGMAKPSPVGTALPTPVGIALITPPSGATIVQNDPSTGCSPNPTRGYGFVVHFAWTAPPGAGLREYRLVVQHVGSFNPALDVRVAHPSFTWTACGSFVPDPNLDNWQWHVTALNKDQQVVAVSEPRAIRFLPCRLADGTPCSAPG